MKTLILNGSAHAHGCTATALGIVAQELQKEGIETEIVNVGHMDIHGCIGCMKCKEMGRCVFKDVVNDLAPKFEEADGLVVGSPVYFAGPTATITAVLDRLFFSTHFSKKMKVGAAVVSARRAGTTAAWERLNKYFTISEIPIVSSRYWNMVHGYSAEDVMKDEEGVQIMQILGRNMAFLMRAIDNEKKTHGMPPAESDIHFTNFIR